MKGSTSILETKALLEDHDTFLHLKAVQLKGKINEEILTLFVKIEDGSHGRRNSQRG